MPLEVWGSSNRILFQKTKSGDTQGLFFDVAHHRVEDAVEYAMTAADSSFSFT